MSPPPYHSLLICFHPDHADVYATGRPIGVFKDGKLTLSQVTSPHAAPRLITPRDVPSYPFDSFHALYAEAGAVLEGLNIAETIERADQRIKAVDAAALANTKTP